jgi:hypothetical protein
MSTSTAVGPSAGGRQQFGEGPLARVAALIYCLLTVDLLILAASAPGIVPLFLLARDAADAPLAVVCMLPVGPAISAALYALRHHRGDLTDLRPAAEFWRGYRLNVGGVLRLWIPWLAGMALVAENLSHVKAAAMPGWWAAVTVVIAVAATLWMANALVITSLFAFRPVDVARLAAYFLGRTRSVPLGTLCLLIVAIGIVDVASEAVLALLAVVFVGALLRYAEPMITKVKEEFTA